MGQVAKFFTNSVQLAVWWALGMALSGCIATGGSGYSSTSSSSSSSSSSSNGGPRSIGVNDPGIRYIGRVALSDDSVEFDWANTQIEFRIEAPELSLQFDDGRNDYNVFVNGELNSVLTTQPGVSRYSVSLPGGPQTVKITKRTGPNFGAGRFLGLTLPQGGQLLGLPEQPAHKIEFIGDSYTVGYGNEGPALDCGGTYRPYENSYFSYAPIAARALNAQSHSIAISGLGAVRNYGDTNTTSPMPMPYYYGRTLMSKADLNWDFDAWVPDAVVIKLGTNDYSTEPSPPADVFIQGVHDLITAVNAAYGQLPIFLLADSALANVTANMQTAAQQQQAMGNAQVRYVQVTHPPQSQLGCDWHPMTSGHQAMANELVSKIRPILGW